MHRQAQVLDGVEFVFEAVEVAEIEQIGAVFLAGFIDVAVVPAQLARGGRKQAAHHAQQAGLAAAVDAAHREQRARLHVKVERGEQTALAAHAFEVVGGQHDLHHHPAAVHILHGAIQIGGAIGSEKQHDLGMIGRCGKTAQRHLR